MCGDGVACSFVSLTGMDTDLKRSWVARDDELDPTLLTEFHSLFLIVLHPERGNVRVSTPSQSPQSLVITLTRSQSPECWSPAACNQHSFIYTRHSDTHHPVYCSHTWASLTISILAYMCLPSDLQYSCDSRSPQLQHDPDPPAKNPTSVITDKNQRTAICVSAHLVSVSALSFNKPVIKTSLYSRTSCLWPVLWQYGAYNASLYYA